MLAIPVGDQACWNAMLDRVRQRSGGATGTGNREVLYTLIAESAGGDSVDAVAAAACRRQCSTQTHRACI